MRSVPVITTAIILALIGLAIGGGGIWLAALGGSVYYIIAGIGILVTGALLMARGDMTNLGVAETPVKLDRVDAGDSEDRVDPVLLQETDQRLATSRHLLRPKL
jgi:Glucose dehydrogenase